MGMPQEERIRLVYSQEVGSHVRVAVKFLPLVSGVVVRCHDTLKWNFSGLLMTLASSATPIGTRHIV